MRAALIWSLFWVASAFLFGGILWCYSPDKALAFLTGYVIEKSLSIDNLFVFYLIFQQFRIPSVEQQRIFSYGITGAIIMRLLLILLGSWLISEFHWVLYLMGVFLLFTGFKMFWIEGDKKDLHQSKLYLFLHHRLHLSTFMIALIFIEVTDLIFAFDSIPAIFAITTDPLIVWSANIFAILGLRTLYFLLKGMVERFSLLKYGIALILIFVGAKMIVAPWVIIPVALSLGAIILLILVFSALSILHSR